MFIVQYSTRDEFFVSFRIEDDSFFKEVFDAIAATTTIPGKLVFFEIFFNSSLFCFFFFFHNSSFFFLVRRIGFARH